MKSLILHIGTHKTGSTALQQWFSANDEKLRDKGVLYPSSGRPVTGPVWGHHLLPWAIQRRRGIDSEKVWAELKKEIEASNAHTVVISSEEFDDLSKAEVARVAEHLAPWSLRVVIYLRNPYDFMVSYYKQIVKSGVCRKTFPEVLRASAGRCNYFRICEAWSAAIGGNLPDIRMYDRISEMPGILADFSTVFSSQQSVIPSDLVEHRRNISPTDRTIGFISFLNRFEGRLEGVFERKRVFAALRRKALRGHGVGKLMVTLSMPFVKASFYDVDDRNWLRSQLESSNAKLAANYLSEEDMSYLAF